MTLITSNFRLKLLALFLSSTTWLVVVYAGNPPDSQVVRGVTIEHGAPPQGLVLLNPMPTLEVTVAGLRTSIAAFRKDSLHATVDLSKAHIGANHLVLRVYTDDQSVTIRGFSPETLNVELDHLGVAIRNVQVRAKGTPDPCCRAMTDVATVVPSAVTLRGPESLLTTALAIAEMDVNRRTSDIQQQLVSVQVLGPDSKVLKSISIDPPQVSVSLQVHPIQTQRTVAVDVQVIGQPATGYHVSGVQVTPPNLLVQGDPGVLDPLQVVRTENISIDGKSSDVLVTGVKVQLPSGVTLVGSGALTVRIQIVQDAARPEPTPSVAPPPPSPSPAPSPSPSPTPH